MEEGQTMPNGLPERVEVLEAKVAGLEKLVAILVFWNFPTLPDVGMPANWYLTRYLSV